MGSWVVQKQKNNLFLKQPDWFALEGLCVMCVCEHQNGAGGVPAAAPHSVPPDW